MGQYSGLQYMDTRYFYNRDSTIYLLGFTIPAFAPKTRLYTFSRSLQQSKQHSPNYQRNAGYQTKQLRKAETLGVGADSSKTF